MLYKFFQNIVLFCKWRYEVLYNFLNIILLMVSENTKDKK